MAKRSGNLSSLTVRIPDELRERLEAFRTGLGRGAPPFSRLAGELLCWVLEDPERLRQAIASRPTRMPGGGYRPILGPPRPPAASAGSGLPGTATER